ncbi:homoserine O-acetyltransferase [Grosmannia clavigera kw1407]|uniref:Homoserine O-acetyltransferase n=1 Tax=Grosmannia clavigera (strain kw1407 / UAMH 11150) TaxID=655863 RepID=F0X8J0_GROCL|nr:homoserine O-acetyltransferase [Grosmannia clavigera kw1407]EFX06153.1 homoserine O-acetyltransferase [Grosmannia clavigera kw1407]
MEYPGHAMGQPENPFAALIPDQQFAIVPSFQLESGVALQNVPVAYTTRGTLSPDGSNAMVICHALTGSADVGDWWGPLLGGPGRAFDVSRFFIICLNSLGSPYGSASPVTAKDGDPSRGRYGPEFPLTTIRDDVRLHKMVLDDLGVRQVAAVIGGSLGGMFVLEWAYLGRDYVRSIVPIATSSRHSAWGISWGEAQRQSIYADPKYEDGYYPFDDPPAAGLGAARMSALLTYRSRNSFEARFGRNIPDPKRKQTILEGERKSSPAGSDAPSSPSEGHFRIHNDGHRIREDRFLRRSSSGGDVTLDPQFHGPGQDAIASNGSGNDSTHTSTAASTATTTNAIVPSPPKESLTGGVQVVPTSTYFSAQSYLRYQAAKFVRRFDSNCYIAMTRKLDTHDVSRSRANTVADALAMIEQPTLVLGIESDGLFTFAEQEELAEHIGDARLERIDSPEGHDAFLLQFEQVNRYILAFLREVLPDIMSREGSSIAGAGAEVDGGSVGQLTKSSVFGEAEVEDITAW